jgi:hypothetical protein
MKAASFILLIGLASITSLAQIQSSTVYLGISSNPSKGYFDINPRIAYFFLDNWMGGLSFSYTASIGSSTSIGAFTRYYIGGKFFLGAGYSAIKPSNVFMNSTQASFESGYAFFVSKIIAIEPSLSYSKIIGDSSSSSNEIGFRFGLSFFILP